MQKTIHSFLALALTLSLATPALAQITESGTGAALSTDTAAPITITTDEEPTVSEAETDDIETVEDTSGMPTILPLSIGDEETETETEIEPTVDEDVLDLSNIMGGVEDLSAITESTETEALFSYRRVVKWGGVITAILLIIVILMQETSSGLSSTFGGGGAVYTSKRGVERVLFRATVLLAVIFGLLNFLAMAA